jgi:hypothetical protein
MKETKEYETARSKQLQSSEAAVIGAMKNVAFMASHDLPNSIMADLNELCKEQVCTLTNFFFIVLLYNEW